MRWVDNVVCSRCGGSDWAVRDEQWTCACGKVITAAEIAVYHKTLS